MINSLHKFIDDPYNADANFMVGLEYEQIGQTASAFSFYLRCAEISEIPIQKYSALLRAGICINSQQHKTHSTKELFRHAITVMPERPEAYWLMTRLHESTKEWHECYMYACIGHSAYKQFKESCTAVGMMGDAGFEFYKAVSVWWVGRTNEARERLYWIRNSSELDIQHKIAVEHNLNTVGYPEFLYTKSDSNDLKIQFSGCENLERNYSQSFQDIFILSCLNGKRNGTYVEIGSGHPYKNNNTALLETEYGWSGISIDNELESVIEFSKQRKNYVLHADALSVNYNSLFEMMNPVDNTFDYLQLDLEPPELTFAALKKIPFDKYKFAVITFEHDFYRSPEYRDLAREYLKNYGYVLMVNDVSFNNTDSFEDWYIHPQLVHHDIAGKLYNITENPKFCKSCVLTK